MKVDIDRVTITEILRKLTTLAEKNGGLIKIKYERAGEIAAADIQIEIGPPKQEVSSEPLWDFDLKFPNHPVFPTKPAVFDDTELAMAGKRCNAGCNLDDRGFVVVKGCPVHGPMLASGDGVTGN